MADMFQPFTLPDWLPLPGKAAKRQALRTLRGLVGGQIAMRRSADSGGAHDDLLAQLLALRDDDTGQHFAQLEMAIAAAMFLQWLHLPDHSGRALPTPQVNVTLRPQGALHARLQRRARLAAS